VDCWVPDFSLAVTRRCYSVPKPSGQKLLTPRRFQVFSRLRIRNRLLASPGLEFPRRVDCGSHESTKCSRLGTDRQFSRADLIRGPALAEIYRYASHPRRPVRVCIFREVDRLGWHGPRHERRCSHVQQRRGFSRRS